MSAEKSDGNETDIVERLRDWRSVHLARLHVLMEEAADGIERLRSRPCPYVTGTVTRYCTLNTSETPNGSMLTDEEREAVKKAIGVIDWQRAYFSHLKHDEPLPSASLRGLLERLGGGR